MTTADITIVRKGDPAYPTLLAQIADPPAQLYCRGNIQLLNSFCVAVVGTRRISDYGRQATTELAGALAAAGITIISGLALGVDAVAHRAALDIGGTTIAVLGAGVGDDTIGPPSNLPLAHDIIVRGGLIVSEYPVGAPAHPGTFPERNRIISGLSHGVVITEADRDSGSLITAHCALDQNRDVFAVPGSIYWPRSIGTNWLISQGARPVVSATDILDQYQLDTATRQGTVSTDDPLQQDILAILTSEGPATADALASKSGTDAAHTMAALTLLELAGAICRTNGIYSPTHS
jgi:DNA processing protein